MSSNPSYGKTIIDTAWGCAHSEVLCGSQIANVKICHVKISDVEKVAVELTRSVLDTSWMTNLDRGVKRSYEKTVTETAQALVKVFNKVAESGGVAGDFGELMVSIGSTRALEAIFEHSLIPISELWKPQLKQNEGFDFHTVCAKDYINFGEAKFSSNSSPHGNAITQALDFIESHKHYRDRVHLVNLVSEKAIANLDDETFGVIAAFSLKASNPLSVLNNAILSAQKTFTSKCIKSVYLIGVSH